MSYSIRTELYNFLTLLFKIIHAIFNMLFWSKIYYEQSALLLATYLFIGSLSTTIYSFDPILTSTKH